MVFMRLQNTQSQQESIRSITSPAPEMIHQTVPPSQRVTNSTTMSSKRQEKQRTAVAILSVIAIPSFWFLLQATGRTILVATGAIYPDAHDMLRDLYGHTPLWYQPYPHAPKWYLPMLWLVEWNLVQATALLLAHIDIAETNRQRAILNGHAALLPIHIAFLVYMFDYTTGQQPGFTILLAIAVSSILTTITKALTEIMLVRYFTARKKISVVPRDSSASSNKSLPTSN